MTVRWKILSLAFAWVVTLDAPAHAAKGVALGGYSGSMAGSYKMKFRDGGASLTCPKQPLSLALAFGGDGRFTGAIDGSPIGGFWRQTGEKNRTVKFGLDNASMSLLNQRIDDAVSSCISSIPDGLPIAIRKLKLKGELGGRRGDVLTVKVLVEFRSKENGFFWNMRGDDKDVFKLKAGGTLAPPPVLSVAETEVSGP